MIIGDNPELAVLFRSSELKDFLFGLLKDLEDPYVLKNFLKEGADKFYEDQIKELSNSYMPVQLLNNEINVFESVVRCIDNQIFKIGDLVIDKVPPIDEKPLPIARLYSDHRGLHVQLKLDDHGMITWRYLSDIEHDVSL